MTDKPQDSAAHEEFTDLFSEYYDDELDDETRSLLESHLATCEACDDAYESFRAPLDAMHGMDLSFAPDDFVRDVTKSINRQSRGAFFSESWLFGFRVPFEAFAAVILAVFGALYLFGSVASPELVVNDSKDKPTAETSAPEDGLMGSALGVHVVGPQECPIDDRHDARGGAIDVSERVELLQIARRQARCLGEGT